MDLLRNGSYVSSRITLLNLKDIICDPINPQVSSGHCEFSLTQDGASEIIQCSARAPRQQAVASFSFLAITRSLVTPWADPDPDPDFARSQAET